MPSPLEFFKQYLTDYKLDLLIAYTNQYSVQKSGKPMNTSNKELEQLAEDLLERKTYSCATIGAHRKGWPLPKSKQKKGDLKMRQKGLIVATQWTDKRQVNILSTNSNPVMTTVECRSKTGMLDLEIPLPVVSYNCGMFGVDLADQHRSYYPVGRVSNKWWRYMLWYLIDISTINSFLLMKKSRTNDSTDSLSQNHLWFHKQQVVEIHAMVPDRHLYDQQLFIDEKIQNQ
ncbi:piggyBac transposable element-derived protein 4 [Biomphalaria glabrata]